MDIYNLDTWKRKCAVCGLELSLFYFPSNTKDAEFGCSDTCLACKKVQPLREKKFAGRYSINHYSTMNSNFMTEDEIKWHYVALKKHMYIKYGKWCDETIHRTILKGFHYSHNYNPQRASKLVFLQTILWSIYLTDLNPDTNREIRHHYSFDFVKEGEEEVSKEIEILTAEKEVDDWNEADVVEWLMNNIKKDLYPHLYLRLTGAPDTILSKRIGSSVSEFSKKVKEEREEIMKLLPGKFKDFLRGRIPKPVRGKTKKK